MENLNPVKVLLSAFLSRKFWRSLRDHMGAGKQKKVDKVTSQATLAYFVNSRSSHVAQTSLYGYLRTRAGTRFPELFKNPDILESINIKKLDFRPARSCESFSKLFHEVSKIIKLQINILYTKQYVEKIRK